MKILISLLAIATTIFATLVFGGFAYAMAATGYNVLGAMLIVFILLMWADVGVLIYFLRKDDGWD